MRPIPPPLRLLLISKDSPVRTLVEAQAEQRSDIRRTRAHFERADGWVQRTHDFPAGNSLTAQGHTTELTLSPGGQSAAGLYELRFKVTITPVVPSGGSVNEHIVAVAVETNTTGSGSWDWQTEFEYKQTRKVGEPDTPIVWEIERLVANVVGLSTSSKIRLRIARASGPGGWSFAVHGFNAATDGDPTISGTKPVTSSSVANPSVITTSEPHLFATGDLVRIAGHTGSTPDINGTHMATVTGDKTFTIPVNVTVAGTGGTIRSVIPGVRYHTGPAFALQDSGGSALA